MNPPQQPFRRLFSDGNFRRIWIASVGLSLGDAVMQIGLLKFFRAHGYDVQTETARLLFAVSFPGALLAMAYLDRWQRRSVLMVSEVLRAVTVVVIAMWLLLIAGCWANCAGWPGRS